MAREVWRAECTCPGAGPARERQQRADERRQEVNESLAEIRQRGDAAADDVEARLRDVYLGHGETPPPGLAGWGRVVAAGTARRGTRTPRLLWMGIKGVVGTVRWAWERPSGTSRDSRAEARKLYRAVAAVALVAGLSTAVAARSSGWRRVSSGAVAVAAWLVGIVLTSLGTAVLQVARSADRAGDGWR